MPKIVGVEMKEEMQYTVAFAIFKQGVTDSDGLAMIAEVQLGFMSGPLAGMAFDGILVKQHRERGMQVVFPSFLECFVAEGREHVEARVLRMFAKAFKEVLTPKPESKFDDFTGVPEPRSSSVN